MVPPETLTIRNMDTGEDVRATVYMNLDSFEPVAEHDGRMLGRISDGGWRYIEGHDPKYTSSRYPVERFSVPPR